MSDTLWSVIDCGSNSFHLLTATFQDGHIQVVHRSREAVRLASYIQDTTLSEEGIEHALLCLAGFQAVLAHYPRHRVRAVGTAAFRQASNISVLLERARAELGLPIEVISGEAEARFIFQGVCTSEPAVKPLFAIDIGGGSTELIVGDRQQVYHCESLPVGCLVFLKRFLADGRVTRERQAEMFNAACEAFAPLKARFNTPWERAVAASGTAQALKGLAAHWHCPPVIDEALMQRAETWLVAQGHVERLHMMGIRADRLPILPCGLAILRGIMQTFDLQTVAVSEHALREGVLLALFQEPNA